MTRNLRGSFTIEASLIIPLILFVFSVLLYTLFYFHDKNIVTAIAHETLAVGSGREEVDEEELERYFYQRMNDRLLLFTQVDYEVSIDEEQIQMVCEAKKSNMVLKIESVMSRTAPEDYIRSVRKLTKIGEKIGE